MVIIGRISTLDVCFFATFAFIQIVCMMEMTLEKRAEKAADLKEHKGYNCCQAVTAVLVDETSLTEEQLYQISSGIALGLGSMEGSCGALVGAAMIMGMQIKGKGSVRYIKQLSNLFKEKSGAVICGELKGMNTGVIRCSCADCVKNAVMAYGEIMGL